MKQLRSFIRAAASFGAVVGLSACNASNSTPGQPFCPPLTPFVELLYPVPNSTGVSASVGQMVLVSDGLTPVRLAPGASYPFGKPIPTNQEPVPNPLPTPIATPGPYAQYLTTTFAVSFVKLQPNTTYQVQSYGNTNPCSGGEAVPPGWLTDGDFTTQ